MDDVRKPIGPVSVIEDLYSNQLNTLLDDLMKKISLKEYDHQSGTTFIIVSIRNYDYNPVVLNEVKRRYLEEGWGNVFYKIVDRETITFQLYFPQINSSL